MQYKIYALALPFDLRCESGIYAVNTHYYHDCPSHLWNKKVISVLIVQLQDYDVASYCIHGSL